MWEYAAVWAVSKETDREPYVPSCIINELEQVFDNITIPSLAHISHCFVDRPIINPTDDFLNKETVYLKERLSNLPDYVVPYRKDILQMFKFKKNILEESHKFLSENLKYGVDTVFVGVHVRRGDYIKVLPALWKKDVVKPHYFLNLMTYFEVKYEYVVFIVLSDDPDWCTENLIEGRSNVVVVRNSPLSRDLAIMAACNHSIIDYGTYGMWGAMMAGGETFLYNLSWGLEYRMSQLMPNWHLIDDINLVSVNLTQF
ncbi:Galactoside 2-alpha-L-fucosyltransferase 2 [Blattella germanica]|nr:Galactoside 2-alpha-L-fucosyltransferase 2 [Blattella germanica]